jgi:hypothetical protein
MSIANVIAQDKQILVGISGGVGYTNLPNDYFEDLYSPKFNAYFGGVVFIPISKILIVGTGINYRKKSRILSDPIEYTDANGNVLGEARDEFYSKCLTVPLSAGITIGNKTKFNFCLGGYWGYLFETGYNYDFEIEGRESPFIVTDEFSRTDYGFFARVGLLVPIYKNLYLNFDVSEELGLKNINSVSENQDFFGKTTMQSLSLGVGVAYAF